MKLASLVLVGGLAVLSAACTTDPYGSPYYGTSQGYVYPSSGYSYPSNYGYYQPRPYYPSRYGYSSPYYNSSPGITFTLPMGG